MATDPTSPVSELLLSAADLARELRVSTKTIRRLDAMGKLPLPVKLGRLLRWRRDELIAWLAAGGPDRDEWERFRR